MAEPEFKAIVLDLFDTLVKWEPNRLPLMQFEGRQIRTTIPWVFPKLEQRLGDSFDRQEFLDVYTAVLEEIALERERDGIEITCHERFVRTLARLVAVPSDETDAFAEELTRIHMAGVRAVTWAPQDRIEAVRRISPHFRLGLVSNFDDAQCGREVLVDTGIAYLFEAVIISAEVRLRKPNPLIFRRMLQMLKLKPSDVLFVGDTPRDDVLGASQCGLRTAWIRKGLSTLPEGIPTPDFVINDLAELPRILGI